MAAQAGSDTSPRYQDSLSLREARAGYFRDNDFGDDGGYGKRWVKLKSKPFPIFFPNTKSRVRSVRLHDLHHIATRYQTTWMGEAEIGAWEIASGCADHWPAWILNGAAFAYGLLISPCRMFAAFVRGRHCRNLYREEFSDALLDETVGSLRRRLYLDNPVTAPTKADIAWFTLWSAILICWTMLEVACVLAVALLVFHIIGPVFKRGVVTMS